MVDLFSSKLVGYSIAKLDTFSSTFQDYFIPWSVREESRLRFQDSRQCSLTITEFEACSYELSKHTMTIFPNEVERLCSFLRGFDFPHLVLCV